MEVKYLNKYVPKYASRLAGLSAHKIREFVSYFRINPSALNHFEINELIENPDLWLVGTEEEKKRAQWLQAVYPSYETPEMDMPESILVCGQCHQRTVDFHQKQTRGADEPMTCFCHCLNCGARWVQ